MARPRRMLAATIALGLAFGGAGWLPVDAATRPGVTSLVSVGADGSLGNGDASYGSDIAITPDGQKVVFGSDATNVVPNDTNASTDIFVRDRRSRTTRLVSANPQGRPGHAIPVTCAGALATSAPAISDDGRYVAFSSCFDDLVPGDTNLLADVFVRDLRTNRTTLVSVGMHGAAAIGNSTNPSISADGRYVAFSSNAANLTPTACGSDVESQVICGPVGQVLVTPQRIYVRDLVKKTTTLVSVSSAGVLSDGANEWPSISPDGRYVAFTSTADNLSTADTNPQCIGELANEAPSCSDVYLRDLKTGKTELISVGLSGRSHFGGSYTYVSAHQVSAGGRYVAFHSGARDLVPNSNTVGVYVRDRLTGRTTKVSVDSNGAQLSIGYSQFSLSANGRFVGYDAETMPYCSPQGVQAARYDVLVGSTEAEDRTDADGHENGCSDYYNSYNTVIASDGRYVAFVTGATDLVRGDTNGKLDVFVRDRGTTLGVGGLVSSHALAVAGSPAFAASGVVSAVDQVGDIAPVLATQGTDLLGASLAYRTASADLFVRMSLAHMPMFALDGGAVLYGVDLTVDGVRYEVRAAKTGPLTASFGLFRAVNGGWASVQSLAGGYGTTGQEVTVALPLRAIGARSGGRLADVSAFTALGGYATGALQVVDRLAL